MLHPLKNTVVLVGDGVNVGLTEHWDTVQYVTKANTDRTVEQLNVKRMIWMEKGIEVSETSETVYIQPDRINTVYRGQVIHKTIMRTEADLM